MKFSGRELINSRFSRKFRLDQKRIIPLPKCRVIRHNLHSDGTTNGREEHSQAAQRSDRRHLGIDPEATLMKIVVWVVALLICAEAAVGELHPIVHVERGYPFCATAGGKWIKPEETAKAIADQTTYRIYGLTQSLGEAQGSKPKAVENDVCTDALSVSLSPEAEKGVIALAAPWNALPDGMRVAMPPAFMVFPRL